jgi:hypothetical protein
MLTHTYRYEIEARYSDERFEGEVVADCPGHAIVAAMAAHFGDEAMRRDDPKGSLASWCGGREEVDDFFDGVETGDDYACLSCPNDDGEDFVFEVSVFKAG